jgi:sec-independent protein translocase protein TatA
MGDALAPWHIIILVIVLVLLFGARRLPGAAQSLGQSMHIFRKSVQGLNPDDQTPPNWPQSATTAANPPEATALAAPPDATQQQLADLQRQVADLQRQSASVSNGQAGQPQAPQTQSQQTDWSPR